MTNSIIDDFLALMVNATGTGFSTSHLRNIAISEAICEIRRSGNTDAARGWLRIAKMLSEGEKAVDKNLVEGLSVQFGQVNNWVNEDEKKGACAALDYLRKTARWFGVL
jgi:hypothetical protein